MTTEVFETAVAEIFTNAGFTVLREFAEPTLRLARNPQTRYAFLHGTGAELKSRCVHPANQNLYAELEAQFLVRLYSEQDSSYTNADDFSARCRTALETILLNDLDLIQINVTKTGISSVHRRFFAEITVRTRLCLIQPYMVEEV